MAVSVEDRLLIHELISLYGHLIDQREFSRLDEIFTTNASFDLSGYGGRCYAGLEEIQGLMRDSQEHPLAHHSTNVVITEYADSSASVISKGLGVGYKGRVGSVVYDDQLVVIDNNEERQWRIAKRKVSLRTVENISEPG